MKMIQKEIIEFLNKANFHRFFFFNVKVKEFNLSTLKSTSVLPKCFIKSQISVKVEKRNTEKVNCESEISDTFWVPYTDRCLGGFCTLKHLFSRKK